jgi:hypothetical protein
MLPALAALPARPAMGRPRIDIRQNYEDSIIRWALGVAGLEIEPSPKGKVIDRVEIVREDIIARSDPYPGLLNYLHMKTRDSVVRQEMLVHPGDPWDAALVEESARNLRKLLILAVVRTVPCRSPEPGRVILLVITKDLWSIRLNTIYSQVGSTVQILDFNPTEQNFLGRNKRLSLHLRLQQLDLSPFAVRDQIAVGQLYLDERVLGSHLRLTEMFDALLSGKIPCGGSIGNQQGVYCPDHDAGDLEGAYALLRLQRPLFSLATKWGFDAWFQADIGQHRSYGASGLALKTAHYDDGSTPLEIPRIYDRRIFQGNAQATRSIGSESKHDLTFGASAYQVRYAPPDGFPFGAAARAFLVDNYVPRSESAAYAFLSYRAHDTRYARIQNLQSFALSEDVLLGHDITLEIHVATTLADGPQPFVELIGTSKYTWLVGDDIIRIWLNGQTRCHPNLAAPRTVKGAWVNDSLEIGIKNVTPRLWLGRIHAQVRAIARANDLDQTRSTLGGGGGLGATSAGTLGPSGVLRGYPSDAFDGANLFNVQIEYRTLPINILTLHLGFVVFYDGGAAYGGIDPTDPSRTVPFVYRHSVGIGGRGHFPQFDKESLRVDLGFPLSSGAGSFGTWFSISFAQAF